ncbi:MAG: hypothetical protein Kow00133_03200 [Amphiplicatus sp.]
MLDPKSLDLIEVNIAILSLFVQEGDILTHIADAASAGPPSFGSQDASNSMTTKHCLDGAPA